MIKGFTAADVGDQSGKTFMVTGANTGIGFEAAKVLAARGGRVLMGCRNPTKAEDARARILADHPDADVILVAIDLGDLASVRAAADVVLEESRLDVLINNAGLMTPPRQLTKDGFESQFGVNHLGPFALTGLLLPLVEKTDGGRIVNTASTGHRFGSINFDDLAAEKSYVPLTRYGASKLANILHAYELDRRLKAKGSATLASAVHPGGTDSDLFRHMPQLFVNGIRPFARFVLNQPPEGAWPTLLAATHPEVRGGDYYGPAHLFQLFGPAKEVRSNRASHDEALAKRLWDWSVELTGVDPGL
ncbi:MAG: SDR family NAD(P)-dependent oxidoreductase [Proteobacteria bacterium]|nr:SDR family NAD(P)-dependent oxidoreductase [Pseudomonadota bacterium]